MKFAYTVQKFSDAQQALLPPFPKGKAEAIVHAFQKCSIGLSDLHDKDLDDDARRRIAVLKELMNISGLQDLSGRSLWENKAERMTEDEMSELSRVVNELAYWFHMQMERPLM
jgi:hypothetical protein